MRLIDADVLRTDILGMHNCYNGFSDTYDKACIIGLVDEQPTVELVNKGHWIKKIVEDGDPFSRRRWYCSVCDDWQTYGESKFCPNCGADMRGET